MSLELNKSAAAVLTAGIVAMTAGFVANLLVHPQPLEQNVYVIEGTGETAEPEDAQEEQLEPVLPLLAEADTGNGESLSRACQACHTFEQGGANKVGPNLWNVIGSDIATTEGFSYSDAMTGLEGQWTYQKLNAFLADPRGFAPGTKMTYGGMRKVEDRADMIAWLRSLSDSPQPLPTEEEIQEVQQAGEEEGGEAAEGEDGEEAADEEGASGAEGESGGEEGSNESGASGEDSSSEGEEESGDSDAEGQDGEQNGEGEDQGESEGDEPPPQ